MLRWIYSRLLGVFELSGHEICRVPMTMVVEVWPLARGAGRLGSNFS
jgi:hypothetical protein